MQVWRFRKGVTWRHANFDTLNVFAVEILRRHKV
jgi:hypothetical protein